MLGKSGAVKYIHRQQLCSGYSEHPQNSLEADIYLEQGFDLFILSEFPLKKQVLHKFEIPFLKNLFS